MAHGMGPASTAFQVATAGKTVQVCNASIFLRIDLLTIDGYVIRRQQVRLPGVHDGSMTTSFNIL
jgi:hypothetical protein